MKQSKLSRVRSPLVYNFANNLENKMKYEYELPYLKLDPKLLGLKDKIVCHHNLG